MVGHDLEVQDTSGPARPKVRGGRPTKAAAIERDARLLEMATAMFLEQGFDATSMERLAEAAMVGKATLYARYADKGALFADVLRRCILLNFEPLEAEFEARLKGLDLEATLVVVGQRFLDLSLTPASLALGRILAAQGARFPELGRLAVEEGVSRQVRLVEAILARFAGIHRYAIADLPLLADLFLSIVLGRAARIALLGVPVEAGALDRRVRAAVRIFIGGAVVAAREAREP